MKWRLLQEIDRKLSVTDEPCMARRRQLWPHMAMFIPAVFLIQISLAQQNNIAGAPTTTEIVQQMVAHNEQRARLLLPYTSVRDYHLKYSGFPHAAEADVVVDVSRDRNSMQFRVISESGSHFLIHHILERLLKTEREADRDRNNTALTPENYRFILVKTETENSRETYVLQVEPKVEKPLLYRGTIWVDAEDYAVVKLDVEPAHNPSFWIRNTEIHHTYQKIGDFWLPQRDRSETKVRLGGSAVLDIDYQQYRFDAAAAPPSSQSNPPSSVHLNLPR